MGLRQDHRELTRQKVLTAVFDLLAEGSLRELSIPAVSQRSGVSVATIYRHFPTKDQLLAAAAAEPSRQATSSDRAPLHPGDDEFAAYVRAMWREFGENMPLLRHQLSSEAGRDMRRARRADNHRALARYIERFGIDPRSEIGERLISMIMVVSGSVALVELHDRQDIDIDEATERSLWAVHALIKAAGGVPPDGGRAEVHASGNTEGVTT